MPTGIYPLEKRNGLFKKGHASWLKDKKMSAETKHKLSIAHTGKILSEEHRIKIGKSVKGNIAWNKGISPSEETRQKISISSKGKKLTKETRHKLSIAHKGKKFSREHCKKISLACRNRIRENHPNWKGGISFEEYPPTFNQQLKDKIRVRDNFTCQICSMPELELTERLHCHHIDYNKKNNELNNFTSLCRKCHIKTNYNREYWKEYFKNKEMEKCLSRT
jgi:hypothetical protein